MDLRSIARALGGEVIGGQLHAQGPGHSPSDRSLSIKLSATAPDGFVVHSFAGDDPIACREYVKRLLNLPAGFNPSNTDDPKSSRVRADDARDDNRGLALRIWRDAIDPRGTPAVMYLRLRGLELPEEAAGEAIRFHSACPFGKERFPAMICLVRDIRSNAPIGVHRTALAADGSALKRDGKTLRLSLGPIAGGAIKITPNEEVTLCLGVGEGVETVLSMRALPEFGCSAVWALLSAAGVASFPLLAGIESLWLAVDHDAAGEKASRACARRWREGGREAFLIRPKSVGADLNDLQSAGGAS